MNATFIDGWVSEPDGRGTWSILWSCLVTISLCTWSALHLKVPKPSHTSSSLVIRRVLWSLAAVMAPEYILWTSANDYFRARRLLRYLKLKQKQQGWTMTHILFAFAGGFWVRTRDGEESKCHPERLRNLIINDSIKGPSISQDELKSRSRADWIVKGLAIAQILWFLTQCLVRAVQHFHVASLEILTVAIIFCSIFTYSFSFQKPQDVEFPVFIEVHDVLHEAAEPNLARDSNESGTMLQHVAGKSRENSTKKEDLDPNETGTLPLRALLLLGCVFGAIHCLAWNSPFPTLQERLAWRICSLATVAIPGVIFLALQFYVLLIVCISMFCNAGAFLTGLTVQVIGHSIGLAYILGRITLIVSAFIGLRALPADAFQTVDWIQYFPHFNN